MELLRFTAWNVPSDNFTDYEATNGTITVWFSGVWGLFSWLLNRLFRGFLFVLWLCKCIHLSFDLVYIYLQNCISCHGKCTVYEEVVINEYVRICTCWAQCQQNMQEYHREELLRQFHLSCFSSGSLLSIKSNDSCWHSSSQQKADKLRMLLHISQALKKNREIIRGLDGFAFITLFAIGMNSVLFLGFSL